MFKKNKKQTETLKEPKEKKVRTVKVGTHKKTVIALWVVLVASVSFILIVVGVFYIIFIIVKYNGKLISFKK